MKIPDKAFEIGFDDVDTFTFYPKRPTKDTTEDDLVEVKLPEWLATWIEYDREKHLRVGAKKAKDQIKEFLDIEVR